MSDPIVHTKIRANVEHATTVEHADCCIVGGGPGGAVLALLLARQGVAVTLLEAHGDFDRDFRGDGLPVNGHGGRGSPANPVKVRRAEPARAVRRELN
jgi:choline dehydrogenase-like flavoprotein